MKEASDSLESERLKSSDSLVLGVEERLLLGLSPATAQRSRGCSRTRGARGT